MTLSTTNVTVPTPPADHCPLAVVMPTRNQAAYLQSAVESVFAQDIPGLRLFVQDGASIDGTPALLAELAQRHPGLHWVSAADAGPADALNRAFARALAQTDATVLGWLNSDDLYTPGAAARALAHLAAHPQHALVYGEAEHIDAAGQAIGPYPTAAPNAAAWADGCPICQPSVFLRRTLVQALVSDGQGPLDTTLKTAFDYELWLRVRARFPGAMGHLPAMQARSRLHDQGLTLRLRETVAMEGMAVVARHLGRAPAHWLLTFAEELLRSTPEPLAPPPLEHLLALAGRAQAWLGPDEAATLRQRLQDHAGLRAAAAGARADLYPDGWTPARLTLRLRRPAGAAAALMLSGRHASPGTLQLQAWCLPRQRTGELQDLGAAPLARFTTVRAEPWRWRIDLPGLALGESATVHVVRQPDFVPARDTPGSTDERALGFLLDRLAWVPATWP